MRASTIEPSRNPEPIKVALRCDECGERHQTTRYVDNSRRTANVCRVCAP